MLFVFIFLSQREKKCNNQTRQVVKETERTTRVMFESNFFSISAHLLVPTVGNGEHPLLVDEHPTTEVVTVVEGGHVWTSVRRTLVPANDLAIIAGNCRCYTHTHTHTEKEIEGNRKSTVCVSELSSSTTFHHITVHIDSCSLICLRMCVCLYPCLYLCLYQQLRSSAAEPAVSWCQVIDQKTPGLTSAHIYILPATLCPARSPLLHSSLFPLTPSVSSSHSVPSPRN